MDKPPDIIDRDREWAALRKCHGRKRPELVFVVGRRRVGKSFVLSRFAELVGGVYFQATRHSDVEQLGALGHTLGEHFADEGLRAGASLPSWEALLRYLTHKASRKPLWLVLDEFTYLADAAPELPSLIQRFWDHDWQASRLRLVLSGSYISAMQRLEAIDQPLYGRRTARLAFGPFDAHDAAAFVPDWSARDKLRLYGTIGHLPGHLALVDPALSLADNIAELCLDPGGRLVDEAQHLLDAFVPNAAVHYSIVAAIATGDRTWSGITSRVGKSGGSILRPVQWLEEMQVIERVVPVTEGKPASSKRAQYRVSDPYMRFWHALIAPLVQSGSIGLADPAALWASKVEPRLDELMGDVFERVCRDWVARTGRPFAPVRLGSWWDARSRNEADLVALSATDDLFVGECKWGRVVASDLDRLRGRARLVERELGHVRDTTLGLFSGSGEFDGPLRRAAARGEVLLVGPEELLEA